MNTVCRSHLPLVYDHNCQNFLCGQGYAVISTVHSREPCKLHNRTLKGSEGQYSAVQCKPWHCHYNSQGQNGSYCISQGRQTSNAMKCNVAVIRPGESNLPSPAISTMPAAYKYTTANKTTELFLSHQSLCQDLLLMYQPEHPEHRIQEHRYILKMSDLKN